MNIDKKIVDDFVANEISFVTTVPCKQLAGVIQEVEERDSIFHIPSNKEDEGMGLCAGAFMGGKRPAIIMQNTAIGVTINTLATLTQFYRMPLPMIILTEESCGSQWLVSRDGSPYQGTTCSDEYSNLPFSLAK